MKIMSLINNLYRGILYSFYDGRLIKGRYETSNRVGREMHLCKFTITLSPSIYLYMYIQST